MVVGSIAMIPWLGYLSMTLPENYVAHNWPFTWVGFDLLLGRFHAGDRRAGLPAPPVADAVGVHLRGVIDLRRVVRSDDRRTQGPVVVAGDGAADRAAAGDLHDHRRATRICDSR